MYMHTQKTHTELPVLYEIITWKQHSKTNIHSFKKVIDSFLIHTTIYSQLSLGMWKILCHEMLFGSIEEVKYLCPVNALDPPSVASMCSAYILK